MTGSSEVAGQASGSGAYRGGIAVAAVTALLTVWTTIVRDDGNGIGFFMVILAVAVGWFAAGFRAAGMARTMAGVAVMQVLLGLLIATAPVTAAVPGGSLKALVSSGALALLWLVSAALFRAAAQRDSSDSNFSIFL
jgi:hypothetical protein